MVSLVLAGGCTAEEGAPDPSGQQTAQPAAQLVSEDDREAIAASLAQQASDLGITQPPEVDIIRVVSQSEWPDVFAECMTAAGFPTMVMEHGEGTQTDIPAGQDEAATLADYTCSAQYPPDPKQDLAELSDAQKETVYTYLVDTLVECIEDRGYTVNDVPSRESFLSGYQSAPPWNPYTQIYASNISKQDVQQLEVACAPNTPPELIYSE